MPRPVRRRPKPNRRRALELLASCRDGCTEAIMLAHGFSIDMMVELVRAGLATIRAERMVAGRRTIEVARVQITEAGRSAVAREWAPWKQLVLKRASASRPSGQWNDDDFDVLANGVVVGRIFRANASPVGASWMWTLAFGHHENRTPTHGYAATREAAMAAFAKSWRRE
jgi:hypothetical protein